MMLVVFIILISITIYQSHKIRKSVIWKK
jgi:hypothetical protein